jgi:DNA-binding MurR/RpiR family transcriptional regulator
MDVKVGVSHSPKELLIESDGSIEEVVEAVDAVLKNGSPVLWLTDKKGRRVGIPADKVAYVDISDEEVKRVGFTG